MCLTHRGPDDHGAWSEQLSEHAIAFSHRRLAIIDLSPMGHQPMTDPVSGSVICYNGEVYNFRALRRELEASGERFTSSSDTEVILRGYRVWGGRVFGKLRGMFALAIYDRPGQRLVLARDSAGIKPLYWYRDGDVVVFASEVRALLASDLVPRHLSAEGLEGFMAFGSLQEPFTMVDGVMSVRPGTWSVIELRGALNTHEFDGLPHVEQKPMDQSDVTALIDAALEVCVERQLESDVPIGLFLSGGVDSAALLAYVARLRRADVTAFTVSFPDDPYDEWDDARHVATHYGVPHIAVLMSPTEVRNALATVITAFDQPSVDGVNTYLVAAAAAQAHLKVALSGLGGDEVFCGYDSFARARIAYRVARYLRLIPRSLRKHLEHTIGRVGRNEPTRKVLGLLGNPDQPYLAVRKMFSPSQIAQIIRHEARSSHDWELIAFGRAFQEAANRDAVSEISVLELRTYLRNTLLRDTDQMAMAHGLEVRVPFLDEDLLAAVFSISGDWRLRGTGPKPLLTNAAGNLPSSVIKRPKRGFDLPWAAWLAGGTGEEIRSFAIAVAGRSNVFHPDGIARLWDAYRQGTVRWSRVWGPYVALRWLEANRVTH